MSNQWMSIVEYARSFNVSDMTVRRRIKTGKLRAVLKDGKYYIPLSEANAPRQYPESTYNAPGDFGSRHIDHLDRGQLQSPPPISQGGYAGPVPVPSPEIRGIEDYHHGLNSHGPNIGVNPSQSNQVHYTPPRPHIAADVQEPLLGLKQASVEVQSLLDFCSSTLEHLKNVSESNLVESQKKIQQLESKVVNLEKDVRSKTMENRDLSQKIEDLELLIRAIDQHKSQ